jgi:Ca2+-binding RTX toxin-like protein
MLAYSHLCLAVAAGIVSAATTFAPAAFAGSVAYTGFDGTAQTHTFTAAAGETNNLVVSRIPNAADPTATCTAFSPCIRISDTNAMTENAGSCVSASTNAVDCSRSGATRTIVLLNDANDSVTTTGPLDDPLTADGGSGTDTITGGNIGDFLGGGSGIDTLNGGLGNDKLEGGAGPDSYNGDDGDDVLMTSYDNDDFHGGNGFDTVDYTGWQSFDSSCFPDPCPIGVDVTLDDAANDGSYDLDGDGVTQGAKDNVRIDVEAVIGTAHADTLDGGPLIRSQEFTGAGGDDTINGGQGDDTVVGSANADWTLTDATLTGAGTDSLSSIQFGTLAGGTGPNVLDASGFSGAVVLKGGDNDDTLTGGFANDSIDGGPGTDTILATADPTHPSLTLTAGALTGFGTDGLSGIERATLHGDSANNTLNASGASIPVTFEGGAGIDTLQGGTGGDALTGGPGNDTLDGAGGLDRVVEAADADFTLSAGALLSPGYGNDTLLGIDLATLSGGAGANLIDVGGFAGAATLAGGAGSDTLTGGGGDDTLNGDDGADTLDGGPAVDTLNGDEGGDSLDGGPAADALNGGDADDVLDGGGDLVNDILHGDAGVNRVVGIADTNFTLTNTNLIGQGNDSLFEIQRATLTGGPGDNALNAGTFTLGPVVLNGGAGSDTLLGGSEGDTLVGGPDADAFDAGAGDDDVRARDQAVDTSLVCGDGVADVANVDTGESADVSCESVLPPPEATILTGPAGLVSSRDATFTFGGSANAARFLCALDGSTPAECTSPKTYTGLPDGVHTFTLRAEDSGGDAGPVVTRMWTVEVTASPPASPPPAPPSDATAPDTTITNGPPSKTGKTTVKFAFSSSEPDSTFECKLDKRAFEPCSSPKKAKRLDEGKHKFEVRAIDAAGNVDPSPAKDKFKVVRE